MNGASGLRYFTPPSLTKRLEMMARALLALHVVAGAALTTTYPRRAILLRPGAAPRQALQHVHAMDGDGDEVEINVAPRWESIRPVDEEVVQNEYYEEEDEEDGYDEAEEQDVKANIPRQVGLGDSTVHATLRELPSRLLVLPLPRHYTLGPPRAHRRSQGAAGGQRAVRRAGALRRGRGAVRGGGGGRGRVGAAQVVQPAGGGDAPGSGVRRPLAYTPRYYYPYS